MQDADSKLFFAINIVCRTGRVCQRRGTALVAMLLSGVKSIAIPVALTSTLAGAVSAAELRDPTRPAWQPPRDDGDVAPVSALELQMLRIDAAQRSALISGQLYRVGDRIGTGSQAATVQKIEVDHVLLSTPAGTRTLHLHAGAFSKHAVRELPARPIKDSGK